MDPQNPFWQPPQDEPETPAPQPTPPSNIITPNSLPEGNFQQPHPPVTVNPQYSHAAGPTAAPSQLAWQAPPPEPGSRFRRIFKSKLAILAIGVLVLLGGSTAAYFGYYVPSNPDKMWSKALSNTAKGYDKLAEYAAKNKGVKGYSIKGSFKSSGDIAADGTFDGSSSDDNGQYKGTLSATGLKMGIELKTIKSPGNSPDIYFKVDGVQGLGTLLGGSEPEIVDALNAINGQWYFIDHTFFDQFAPGTNSSTQITGEDVGSALKAVGDASREYIFTSDSKKAAIVLKDKIGKEKQDGLNTYHYRATVNKQNLKNYVDKLCNNLKSSKINKLFGGDAAATEEAFGCADIKQGADNVNESKTADVWVDTKTKLLHKIRFSFSSKSPATGDVEVQPDELELSAPQINSEGYFEVFQNYSGGDEFPLGFNYQNTDTQKYTDETTQTKISANVNLKINMKTNTYDISGKLETDGQYAKTTFESSLNITPNNSEVKVEKPAAAKNIIELFNDLMGDINAKARDTERKTDINALHGQLEAYQAQYAIYPTLAEMNDASWRSINMKGLDSEALKDPDGASAALAGKPAADVYSYEALPAGCDNIKTDCTSYTLTASLDAGGTYIKQALN